MNQRVHKNTYESIIDFSDNEIAYDNLGRLHLAIQHTGQASLFLFSNKYCFTDGIFSLSY